MRELLKIGELGGFIELMIVVLVRRCVERDTASSFLFGGRSLWEFMHQAVSPGEF